MRKTKKQYKPIMKQKGETTKRADVEAYGWLVIGAHSLEE